MRQSAPQMPQCASMWPTWRSLTNRLLGDCRVLHHATRKAQRQREREREREREKKKVPGREVKSRKEKNKREREREEQKKKWRRSPSRTHGA